jgi:PIN domain nuclease of toxin-antitoxin system
MKYLIDTHFLLWSLFSPEKISRPIAKILKEPGNRIFVSTITFWEIALKFSLNKLELEGITPGAEDAASFYHLPRISHKDPFDRMLIWQAIREKLVLISKDGKISAYEEYGLKILSIY